MAVGGWPPVSSDLGEDDAGPLQAQAGMGGRYSVDARGGMGVQVGEGNTQIIYTYNRLTWTDGVAPPPLVSVSGVVDSPYRGLNAFEEQDAAFSSAAKRPPPKCWNGCRGFAGRGSDGGVGCVGCGQIVAAAGRRAAADPGGWTSVRAGGGGLAVPGAHPGARTAG